MADPWVKRRAHPRRLESGRVTFVCENWAYYERNQGPKRNSYKHPCPKCGARVLSVHMPNGGWAHFEGEPGMTRIKHPCLHRGEGLCRVRDTLTLDLFQDI
ncbi:hypothetical protein SAMN05444123_11844 [Rhodopseudomonas pseudopalustris]|uniref:PLAT domain-containing protein n=1 Tax=Rhodopseudomonas pseudopalustris TaxID=1513892 RepID=A0A1H8XAK0_9BRAD|nr:hypothetical protein SAMN05444123_11844 [Rhodopseudomonas pseudopalustris]